MVMHIKSLVTDLIHREDNNSRQLFLLKNWHTILGKLAVKVKLEKINNDTLVLGVYDTCWMQELYLLSNVIINQINSKLDTPWVKSLRFKNADWKKPVPVQEKKAARPAITIELTNQEICTLEKIKDPELSRELKKFLIKCHTQKYLYIPEKYEK